MNNEYEQPKTSKDYDHYLLKKYPWTAVHNWEGKLVDVDHTEFYNNVPDGWKLSILSDLVEELDAAVKELPKREQEKFYLVQVKEKYGALRIYPTWYTEKISKIL